MHPCTEAYSLVLLAQLGEKDASIRHASTRSFAEHAPVHSFQSTAARSVHGGMLVDPRSVRTYEKGPDPQVRPLVCAERVTRASELT